MLFIFPPKKTEFKVNQSAEFECHGVQHYFSFGYIFGIQVENGTIMFLQEGLFSDNFRRNESGSILNCKMCMLMHVCI